MHNKILIILILTFSMSFSQTKKERSLITKKYNLLKLKKLQIEFENIYITEKNIANQFAKENDLPIIINGKNGYIAEIQRITDGKPIYYETKNINAARSTRASFLHNGGGMGLNIEGQNMTAYVWDGRKASSTHNEFMINGVSKITNGDADVGVGTTNNNHGTHVTGIIAAKGFNVNAKGMAPEANVMAFNWNNDLAEVTTETTNGMLLSNHSYGAIENLLPDWVFGAYTIESRRWDLLMYAAPYYLQVSAAGNAGNDSTSNDIPLENSTNRDKLSYEQVSKNGFVVANALDLNVDINGDLLSSPSINSSSSQGPTDDYRIKPDITGNGTSVFSPIGTSNNSYASLMGTSMASPNIMGSLLLLQQLYNQEKGQFALAATLKGLAIHTADNGDSLGPDAVFGWGYLNSKKTAEIIIDNENNTILNERTLNDGETLSFEIVSDGTNNIKATISWTDPASNNVSFGVPANNTSPVLVNDLDIRITKDGVTYFPWKLTSVYANAKGDNIVDPLEKIEIINPQSGSYTVTISHKSTLVNSNQNYSLIVSGITSTNLNVNSNSLKNIKIWPNPNNGILNISLINYNGLSKIKITNLLGKNVYNKQINLNNNNRINISNLEKGIYLFTIENDNKKYNKKLIIK